MMANASPAAVNASEIVSTLRFADRAKQVQNKAKVNYDPQAQLVIDLTEENKRLKAEIEKLKSCIEVEKTRSMLLRLDSNTSLDEVRRGAIQLFLTLARLLFVKGLQSLKKSIVMPPRRLLRQTTFGQ